MKKIVLMAFIKFYHHILSNKKHKSLSLYLLIFKDGVKESNKKHKLGCRTDWASFIVLVRFKKDSFNFHPTLKPVDLMNHLVKLISFEGQTILDPFMGSGSTGVACLNLKRKFIGYELEKGYFEIAKKRIKR